MAEISIIIPVYNCEKYLTKCLESVVKQTFKDFEVLCVNDGSTDGSATIVEQFVQKDDRFRLINQENQGASAARNNGLRYVSGRYIMFLDADDWYEADACEKAYDAIISENADVALFSGIWEYTNQSVVNHALGDERLVLDEDACADLRRKMFGLVDGELGQIVKFDYLSLLYLKIYRTDIIREKGVLIPDIRQTGSFEDGLFNIYYFKYVKKAVYTGLPLYHYRKDNDTSITTRYNPNLPMQWEYLFSTLQSVIDDECLGEKCQKALNSRIAYSIVGIGGNCLNAPISNKQKRKAIKVYLRSEWYRKAIKNFPIKYTPLIWKPLFVFARWKWATCVYWLLSIIKKIRKNKNN